MYRDWNNFDHKLRAFSSINIKLNRVFLPNLLKDIESQDVSLFQSTTVQPKTGNTNSNST